VRSRDPNRPLHSSELAQLAGVSTDTVRFYERNQLLPARRSAAGYRLFSPEALIRVRMIRSALDVGFSIKELQSVFAIRDRGGTPCHQVRKLGAQKLREIGITIRILKLKHRQLKRTLVKWDTLLRKAQGQRADLLEVFARQHKGRTR
jgi:DNA-binding transcriptional MerR regulator